ncbi:MAG: hypothetical protein NC331_11515 [Lachnospiraceae bacterium]|nr:hypothetical protein [Lachnospiraceae bacterium]MCM1239996.1 hypothetical protein [Lachnospiraceae bacterium]
MSNVKERIIGAVTVMDEKDAEKIWKIILANFALMDVEEVQPDENEQRILDAYASGDPDYQPHMSQEALLKELGLTADPDQRS